MLRDIKLGALANEIEIVKYEANYVNYRYTINFNCFGMQCHAIKTILKKNSHTYQSTYVQYSVLINTINYDPECILHAKKISYIVSPCVGGSKKPHPL